MVEKGGKGGIHGGKREIGVGGSRIHVGRSSKPPAFCRVPLPGFPSRATAPGNRGDIRSCKGGGEEKEVEIANPRVVKGKEWSW